MTTRISINPNRADVQLNIEYAMKQVQRAIKKAEKHHPERKRMMTALLSASKELGTAWALAKGPP